MNYGMNYGKNAPSPYGPVTNTAISALETPRKAGLFDSVLSELRNLHDELNHLRVRVETLCDRIFGAPPETEVTQPQQDVSGATHSAALDQYLVWLRQEARALRAHIERLETL